ncbi:mediator complex subunit [Orbilia ellipsospora]|uniref:Mediator of RNA polymerase II transcription subunit 14 n=1 Tax=Orbilia ellipsospora TaxID=2528407 RepID=A0AAV9XBZ1_9PEZI
MPAAIEINGHGSHDGKATNSGIVNGNGKGRDSLSAMGTPQRTDGSPMTDGDASTALVRLPLEDAPQLPHITQGFQSLSTIINRTVQTSYGKLLELVDGLQDAGDAARRKRLMKYLSDTRQQFIKVLVLAQWAGKNSDVSKVIDLKVWMDQQRFTYDRVVWEVMEVQRSMFNAKVPNPDLATAVRTLSTGDPPVTAAHQYYVPPKALTSKDILKTFNNINTLLHLRFNLHEIPPSYFNKYEIHSGRVTFTSPHEFELDMSIADEDHSSQLYFIDLRLIFKPALKTLPMDRLRGELEGRANDILKHKGLVGIYDFLHDFIMTHKIAILRRQFIEMAQGKWSDTLYITMIKRTLVVQYWLGKPGPKHWIEIGIRKGNPEQGIPSTLSLRWMKNATDSRITGIVFDVENLSAEALLKSVIYHHTTVLLKTIYRNLNQFPIFSTSHLDLQLATDTSSLSKLIVQLTPSRNLTVMIEPITGRFALQRPSHMVIRGENTLNQNYDAAVKAHETISRIRFMTMQEEIEGRARSMGWETLKMLNPRMTDLKKYFGSSTMYIMYLRKKSWSDNWILAVSLGVTGDFWWIVEVADVTRGWTINDAQRLPISGNQQVTYQFLENLEKMVASFITLYTNTRKLSADGIDYRLIPANNTNAAIMIPTLNINFKALTKSDWGANNLRMSLHDLDRKGNITVLVEGRMKTPMTRLHSADLSAAKSDVAFHPRSGTFIMQFVVSVGSVVTDAITERLHRIERLIGFITTVQKYKLTAKTVTLGKIGFIYNRKPELSAEVSFDGEHEMELVFDNPSVNPHRRISSFLRTLLNQRGLTAVVGTLYLTLPLLAALDTIEDNSPEDEVFVLARSSEWYRVEYVKKNFVIDIKLRTRRDSVWWFIHDPMLRSQLQETNHHDSVQRLRHIWMQSGQGFEGLKNGLVANKDTVGKLLRKIHTTIMSPTDPSESAEATEE